MATTDSVEAYSLLQAMAPAAYDSSRLIDTAAIAYAHVDGATIASLRTCFAASVRAQFQVQSLGLAAVACPTCLTPHLAPLPWYLSPLQFTYPMLRLRFARLVTELQLVRGAVL